MRRWCFALFVSAALARAEPLEEWVPYAKTGLFPAENALWLAPDMEKERIRDYTARLLDGARAEDARAMATLGRFFFVRGDHERAGEWLGKGARAGHPGAQFDFGVMRLRGLGQKADRIEAYAWLWLATWEQVPGAEETLRQATPPFAMGEIIAGVKLAALLRPKP